MEMQGYNSRRKRNIDFSAFREKAGREQDLGIDWHKELQRNEYEEQISAGIEEDEIECEETGIPTHSTNPKEETKPSSQHEQAVPAEDSATVCKINGGELQIGLLQKQACFAENHQKLTIYMEKDLLQRVKGLKEARYIQSYSWLVNEAVKHYLLEKRILNE
jgi:hypothetical protein